MKSSAHPEYVIKETLHLFINLVCAVGFLFVCGLHTVQISCFFLLFQIFQDGDRFWRMPECYIRGSTIKYLRIPDEVIDMVKEEVIQKAKGRGDFKARGGGNQRGRGRGNKTMDVWFLLNVFCFASFYINRFKSSP